MEIIQINSFVDDKLCSLYFQIAFSPRIFPEVNESRNLFGDPAYLVAVSLSSFINAFLFFNLRNLNLSRSRNRDSLEKHNLRLRKICIPLVLPKMETNQIGEQSTMLHLSF